MGLTGVNVHNFLAIFALHRAAPLELTLALGDTFDPHGVVAPAAAHDLTAVCASGRLVTHSACRSQGACGEKENMFFSNIFPLFLFIHLLSRLLLGQGSQMT